MNKLGVLVVLLAGCGSSSSSGSSGSSTFDCGGTLELSGGLTMTIALDACVGGGTDTQFGPVFTPMSGDKSPATYLILDPGRKLGADETGTFPLTHTTLRRDVAWSGDNGVCTLTLTARGQDAFGNPAGKGSLSCSGPLQPVAPSTAAPVTIVKADFTTML